MENDVLAGDVPPQTAAQVYLHRGRHLEPCLAYSHSTRHISRADACGEGSECAVGAGVGIRSDDEVSGSRKSFFGYEGVLYAHFADVVEVGYVHVSAEITAHSALLRRLYVLVGSKVVHYHRDLVFVEHAVFAELAEFPDSHRRGDIVAEDEVEVREDKLACCDHALAGMSGKYLLRHCHTHRYHLPLYYILGVLFRYSDGFIEKWIACFSYEYCSCYKEGYTP